jgi:hypothetical protein
MRMRWLLASLLLILGATRMARADDVLFYWADKKGTVHATQNIDEVPEPYRAMYHARLKELEEEKKKQQAAPQPVVQPTPTASAPVVTSTIHPADAEAARQKAWRAEIAKWRTELRLATENLQRIQAQLDQTNMNPVLRTTPQVQAQAAEIEEQRQKAIARVEIARKTLAEDLPARAKRESVPPRWFD